MSQKESLLSASIARKGGAKSHGGLRRVRVRGALGYREPCSVTDFNFMPIEEHEEVLTIRERGDMTTNLVGLRKTSWGYETPKR